MRKLVLQIYKIDKVLAKFESEVSGEKYVELIESSKRYGVSVLYTNNASYIFVELDKLPSNVESILIASYSKPRICINDISFNKDKNIGGGASTYLDYQIGISLNVEEIRASVDNLWLQVVKSNEDTV